MDAETKEVLERLIDQINALTEAVESVEQATINVGRGLLLVNARLERMQRRLGSIERKTLPN